ncbi:MAG: hypothetical protein JSR41_09815 [Proteobacteria bacterium]|nr:hypothetical protein [Pseudomonadota bacterium]
MSTFLVKNVVMQQGEVERALIVTLVQQGSGATATFGASEEREVDRHELANLVAIETVRVFRWDEATNTFSLGDRVSRKPGQEEYLMSVDAAGKPTPELFDLPTFTPAAPD